MATWKPLKWCRAAALVGMFALPAAADISQTFDLLLFNYPAPGYDFTVEVSDSGLQGSEGVRFRIRNDSDPASYYSTITGIYFDDGVLLQLARVGNPDGVLFEQGSVSKVSPADLPGGNTINFETSSFGSGSPKAHMFGLFAADAAPPPTDNGVSTGEYVDIFFILSAGATAQNVIDMMSSDGNGDGLLDVRVGVHVQQLGEDAEFSGSAVSVIPAPAAGLLGLIGLGLIGWMKKQSA